MEPRRSFIDEEINREHIDDIRWRLEKLQCKTPENQEVKLYKNEKTKLAVIEIKSGAKNALSGKMISQLTQVLDQLYEWPRGRGVLICGHNGTFCSGSDLISVKETASEEYGFDLAAVMQYNFRRLQLLPMISVALIEGYALGGGAELASAADIRLMEESAKIGFVHIKVGVCCGWGGGARLVQLLGPSRALEILSSGRLVGAQEALNLGLTNEILHTSQLDGSFASDFHGFDENGNLPKEGGTFNFSNLRLKALEFLRNHTIGDPETIKALKSMVDTARSEPLGVALANEAHLFASTWGKEPHLRALACKIKHK